MKHIRQTECTYTSTWGGCQVPFADILISTYTFSQKHLHIILHTHTHILIYIYVCLEIFFSVYMRHRHLVLLNVLLSSCCCLLNTPYVSSLKKMRPHIHTRTWTRNSYSRVFLCPCCRHQSMNSSPVGRLNVCALLSTPSDEFFTRGST
jgi:hypothetical protein